LAAVASIQWREAALLAHHSAAGPRLAARAHAPAQRRDNRGGIVGRFAHRLITRQHVLALAAIGPAAAHARPQNRLALPAAVAETGFRAGPPIRRSNLRIMTRPAERGYLLQPHLFGDTAQTLAQLGHE